MQVKIVILDRRTFPLHDKAYYAAVADYHLCVKRFDVRMPDGKVYRATTVPEETEDTDDRLKLCLEVSAELYALLDANIRPVALDLIPDESARSAPAT